MIDLGISESGSIVGNIAKKVFKPKTDPNALVFTKTGTTDKKNPSDLMYAAGKAPSSSQGAPSNGTPTTRTGSGSPISRGSIVSSKSQNDSLKSAVESSTDAADAAKEAKLLAAKNRYKEVKNAAEDAKDSAAGNYQWLIDTLGSNKKDSLSQIATQETEGLDSYTKQQQTTQQQYDKSRQEILSTYRDLTVNQQKIMRGSGSSSSSRSQEAELRLNNLMGKDLTTISQNEADSLALIGSTIEKFKQKIADTRGSIEREVQGKLDKAALDQKALIDSIDQTIFRSKNDRAEAYAEAEAQLADSVAQIKQWEAGLKAQAEQSTASAKESLDGFIADVTDGNKALNSGIAEKTALSNEALVKMGYTPLEQNSQDNIYAGGTYQKSKTGKYKSIEEIQAALNSGEIDAGEAESLKAGIGAGTQIASNNDPLLSALLG